jgi:hypothetical protein
MPLLLGCALTSAFAPGPLLQYHERVASMMQAMEHIPLGQLHGGSVAVLLGSSVLRPREVYCFSFPASMDQPGGSPALSFLPA